MPAAAAIVRVGVDPLRYEPAWPAWAEVSADYRFAPEPGAESVEFADGVEAQAPAAASTTVRRTVRVEVPAARVVDWRRFLATAPGVPMRWVDPEDGVERRVVLVAAGAPTPVRQVAREGRPRWESEITLSGFSDDTVEA